MSPQAAYLPGYVIYLLMIFLPGVGLGELLGVWSKDSTLTERAAYAFGIGLAVDTVVLFVRTSGLAVGGVVLRGIGLESVYFLLALGTVALGLSVAYRRRFTFPAMPKKADWVLAFVVGAVAVIELAHFQKYPIFPEYQSADYGLHVEFVQSLISGARTSLPSGILYYGVHYQLASALLLVGGEPLVTLQRTMALLVFLSPMLVYLAAKSLFLQRLTGLVVAGIYGFSATVWYVAVFNSGLFPNFFGVLAVLFLLVAVLDLAPSLRSARGWVVFALALLMIYLSHYTDVTILPALLLLPLFQFLKDRRKAMGYLVPGLVAVVPGVLGILAFPGILDYALGLAEGGGASLSGSTMLSTVLQGLPVLSNLALLFYDDVGLVFLLIFSAICLYRGLSAGRVLVLVPLVWFVALLAAAPQNLSSWRFSYEATVPLILMGGAGVSILLPKPRHSRSSRRRNSGSYSSALPLLAVLLIPLVVGSWGTTAVTDAAANTTQSAQAQRAVYTSMLWLKANTSSGLGYLSATDWRYTYSDLIVGTKVSVPPNSCFTNPQQVQRAALAANITYIIVTSAVTCTLPPNPQLFLWNTLKPASNLTLIYSNSDVKVFEVA